MDLPGKLVITEDLNKISENANIIAQPTPIFALTKVERTSDKERKKNAKLER